MSKFKDMIESVKEQRQIQPGKQTKLEKGDFTALVIAAFQVFGPVLIGILLFFALIIWILVIVWK